MKNLLCRAVGLLAVFAGPQTLSSGASPALRAIPRSALPALSLESSAFEFPDAGERNNNRTMGDFCCTGETATVRASQGAPVGYIYFHDSTGELTAVPAPQPSSSEFWLAA